MTTHGLRLSLCFLCTLLFFTHHAHAAGVSEFLLFYSNDVHGELAPCG